MLQLNYDSPTYLDPRDPRTSHDDLQKQARLYSNHVVI
jgi:hypothetical protein